MKQLDLFQFFQTAKNFQNSSKKTEPIQQTDIQFKSHQLAAKIQPVNKQQTQRRQPEISSTETATNIKKKLQNQFISVQQNENCLNHTEIKFENPLKDKIAQIFNNVPNPVQEETQPFFNSENKKELENKKESKTVELSKQTQDLINKLKSQQNQDLQNNQKKESLTAKYFNGPSLRQKYEELTSDLRDIALPFEYKMLFNLFVALDKTIQYLNQQHQPSLIFYKDLKQTIFKTYQLNFSLKKLKQINYLYQNAYQLEWQKNKNSNELDLMIQLPKNQELSISERSNCFQALLNNYFKNTCLNSTEQLSKRTLQFSNPLEIPTIKLPIMPVQLLDRQEEVTIEPIENFLKQNSTCNERMKKVLEETVEQIKKDSKNSKTIEISKEDKKLNIAKSAGLSDKLIAKIQEKEKALSTQKSESTNNKEFLANKQKVKTVAQIIKIYITLRSVSNVFFVQLIDHIYTANKTILMTKQEIADIIKMLTRLCPNWLNIINQPKGIIISFNKSFEIQEIIQSIDEAEL